MAPRSSRRPHTKSHSIANSTKNPKFCCDQDDIDSSTTAASDSGSEQDRILQGTPENTPTKTSLKSLRNTENTPTKTSLKSLTNKAKLFVPTEELDPVDLAMMMPTCMPTPGKDCLAGLIHGTLGSEVWNLNMMDGMMPYSQQWYTAVEITIPEVEASMCHLVTSGDADALELARQSGQSKAIRSLKQALQGVSEAVLQPADQGAQICVEFCAGNRGKLCHEFSHFGSCPRGANCRWEHALIELFMINIVLAPLGQWSQDAEMHADQATGDRQRAAAAPKTAGRWQPSRPPMPPAEETAGMKSSAVNKLDTDTQKEISELKPLSSDSRAKNPRLTSQKKWSDMQDESDDDLDCYTFG